MIKILLSVGLILVSLSAFSSDADAQVKQRIRFARGTSATSVSGTVRGYAYRDYIVGASAGQMTRVAVQRSSGANPAFSIFRPNGEELGTATETDAADGELPVSGDYVIRVLMMRSDARRRGSFSSYKLSITIE